MNQEDDNRPISEPERVQKRIFHRELTPFPDPQRASDSMPLPANLGGGTTSQGRPRSNAFRNDSKPPTLNSPRICRKPLPHMAALPEDIKQLLLQETHTNPLSPTNDWNRWWNAFMSDPLAPLEQSTYSMFLEYAKEILEEHGVEEVPVDLWFKLPESVRMQWRLQAGFARLDAFELDEKINGRRESLGPNEMSILKYDVLRTQMREEEEVESSCLDDHVTNSTASNQSPHEEEYEEHDQDDGT